MMRNSYCRILKKIMLNIDEKYLKIIKDILKKYVPENEVRVFGSRLTDKAKSYSDIDIAIVGKSKIDRQTMIRLKEEFENSDIPFRVDVLDWHRISDSFKKIIEKEYVIL